MDKSVVALLGKFRKDPDPEVRRRVEAVIDHFAAMGRELKWIDPGFEGDPKCRSGYSGAGTKLTFRNASAKPVLVYWIEWDGSRRPWRGELAPGATAVCERSHIGHYWLICDKDKKGLGIYKIDRKDAVIVVAE
jgi:hypothetical protein